MKDLQFKDRNELRDYIRENREKSLGSGREGTCYLLKDGTVIKLLHQDYYPAFALQFKDFFIPTFYFARNGAYINDMVAATMMEHAEGDALDQKRPDQKPLLLLGDQLEIVVRDVKKISDKHVLMKDFHPGNMIYNGSQFQIVDTLPFLLLPGGNYHTENMREVMNRVYDFLFANIEDFHVLGGDYSYRGKMDRLEHPRQYLENVKCNLYQMITKTNEMQLKK